jgi:D-cysteine desulfhydrase
VVACGSGGTAAGVALGARRYTVASCVIAVAVCDNRRYFESRLEQIIGEAAPMIPDAPCLLVVEDEFIGPGYAVASAAQRACIASVARTTGLVLDPVYSGKAMYALCRLPRAQSTLFIHTGGLPGLLAQATTFDDRSARNR